MKRLLLALALVTGLTLGGAIALFAGVPTGSCPRGFEEVIVSPGTGVDCREPT